MMRSDEDRQVKPGLRGAGDADSPGAARAAQSAHDREAKAEEPEHDHKGSAAGHEGEDSSMKRSPSGTRSATSASQAHQRSEMSEGKRSVSSGGAPKSKTVEADHVVGTGGRMEAKGAEGVTDDASSKANRRENLEPERERDEKAAVKSTSVNHAHTFGDGNGGHPAEGRNVMGHGFRETVAKNTM